MSKKKPPPRKMGRPATGQTPKRYFRMDDDAYAQVEASAEAAKQSTSEFIREALQAAVKRQSKRD